MHMAILNLAEGKIMIWDVSFSIISFIILYVHLTNTKNFEVVGSNKWMWLIDLWADLMTLCLIVFGWRGSLDKLGGIPVLPYNREVPFFFFLLFVSFVLFSLFSLTHFQLFSYFFPLSLSSILSCLLYFLFSLFFFFSCGFGWVCLECCVCDSSHWKETNSFQSSPTFVVGQDDASWSFCERKPWSTIYRERKRKIGNWTWKEDCVHNDHGKLGCGCEIEWWEVQR